MLIPPHQDANAALPKKRLTPRSGESLNNRLWPATRRVGGELQTWRVAGPSFGKLSRFRSAFSSRKPPLHLQQCCGLTSCSLGQPVLRTPDRRSAGPGSPGIRRTEPVSASRSVTLSTSLNTSLTAGSTAAGTTPATDARTRTGDIRLSHMFSGQPATHMKAAANAARPSRPLIKAGCPQFGAIARLPGPVHDPRASEGLR